MTTEAKKEKRVRVRCNIINSEGIECGTMTWPGPRCAKCEKANALGHKPCSRCIGGWVSIANSKRLGKTTCPPCTHELQELAIGRPAAVDRLIRKATSTTMTDYKSVLTEDGDLIVSGQMLYWAVCARVAIDKALAMSQEEQAGGLTRLELSEILTEYVRPLEVRRDRSRSRGRRPTVRTRSCELRPRVQAVQAEEQKRPLLRDKLEQERGLQEKLLSQEDIEAAIPARSSITAQSQDEAFPVNDVSE